MAVPAQPKIYHILHVDRLRSIIADGALLCDAELRLRSPAGTAIGMNAIKDRRLNELLLTSHPDLYVGKCVPFYFCPRSIMLYLLHRANHPDLTYRGGQGAIIHLEADLQETVGWAEQEGLRWAFTLSNAGSRYFEDRCSLDHLDQLDWEAIEARDWQKDKEHKQAEFLIEQRFPWELVSGIGVHSGAVANQVYDVLQSAPYKPAVRVRRDWYY